MGEPANTDKLRVTRCGPEGLNRILKRSGIFCGVPVVEPGDDFILAKNDSPRMRSIRKIVAGMQGGEMVATDEEDSKKSGPVVRNEWCIVRGHGASAKQFNVRIVEENPEAPERYRRVRLEKEEVDPPAKERCFFVLNTLIKGLRALPAAERKALTKLRELVNPATYEHYLITGGIFEEGKSGVGYLIRRHRPTLAMRMAGEEGGEGRILCTLCLHPLGYFHGTWVGALPPTDEVIAHLLFIRGDEHFFWRKANQIPIDEPNSGI